MKKRFLNALILGAVLLSTGAVTSCKDYDDDINNLQSQIDKLSQLESLKTDVATLQSAVSAAQSDATKALADAKAAADKADKAATAEQLKELQKALDAANELIAKKADKTEVKDLQEQLDALKKLVEEYKGDNATLSAAVAAQVKDLLEKSTLAADVTDLESRVEALEEKANQGGGDAEEINTLKAAYKELKEQAEKLGIAVSTMITDIQMYTGVSDFTDPDPDLSFLYIVESADYTWYDDVNKGASMLDDKNVFPEPGVKFKKGGAYFGSDSLLIRVSPATAILKAENISFINSQGKSLDGIVKVDEVRPYEGLLTAETRANASATGLWVVKVKPATTTNEAGDEIVDIEAFKAATDVKVNNEDRKVLYAVAVKNFGDETAEDETRRVTSEYDVTAGTKTAGHAGEFTVNGKKVSEIFNRYEKCEDGTDTKQQELVWKTGEKYGPKTAVVYEEGKTGEKYNAEQGDNRQSAIILPVEIRKDITIDFTNKDAGDVKGFFVVLDERNALESAPSEIRAWRSFDYTGVGYTDLNGTVHRATYFEGNKGAIRVNDTKDYEGDVIGFRVYAVNYDGTLVDPDGQAFYVVLGNEVTQNDNKYDVTYVNNSTFASKMIAAADFFGAGYKNLGADGVSAVKSVGKDADGKELQFTMHFYEKANGTGAHVVYEWPGDDNWSDTLTWSKVNFVQIVFKGPGKYIDGAEYTQEFYMTKKGSGTNAPVVNLRKITVTGKKVMPSVPAYTFKTGQNKYQWLVPDATAADGGFAVDNSIFKAGEIDLNAILLENTANGWAPLVTKADAHFKFTVKTSKYNDEKNNGYTLDATPEWNATTEWKFTIANNPKKQVIADNTTSHAVSAKYFYKGISKRLKKDSTTEYDEDQNYEATATSTDVTEFVYCSWTKDFKTDDTNWVAEPYNAGTAQKPDWKTKPNNVLKWEGTNDIQRLNLDHVKVTSDLRGIGNKATLFNGRTLGELIASKFLKIDAVKLNGPKGDNDKYFKVEAKSDVVENAAHTSFVTVIECEKIAGVQSPIEHEETLSFKVMDCFGNKYTVSLPVTVKP